MTAAFLGPALLAGLAAVLVPLLIHLISKRRARRVRFALMELLLKSQRRTARSIRLQQLLLLLLRMLAIAALALAIAQPFLADDRRAQPREAPLVVVVVVDGTASMQARVGGRSAFERARRAALEAVRSEPADVRTAAVACGTRSESAAVELAAPTFERARIITALEELQPGVFSVGLPECLDRAAALARTVEGGGERRVLVFSDLAAHALRGQRTGADGQGVVFQWAPAFDSAPPNHAIIDASVERVSTRVGAALSVPFNAVAYGDATALEVDLVADGARAARLTVQVGDGRPAARRFHLPLSEARDAATAPGPGSLVVATAPDAFTLDDAVPLPVDAAGPLDVLVINGAPQALRFQDEVFYLENALDAVRGGRARLRFRTVGADQVRRTDFATTRVVVLANVGRLDDDAAAALVEHVQAGAGLLITMGDQIDVEWSNARLGPLLPSPLRGSKGQALLDDSSVAEVLSLSRFATEHPVLASLGGAPDTDAASGLDVPGLSRVRTHTLMLVEPAGADAATVIARFSNGAPALVEHAVGAGRSLTLLTTVDRDWSDLAIRPGFVPLMQQAVLYLGGALEDVGPRAVVAGAPRLVRVPTGAVEVIIEKPSGARVTLNVQPDQRTVTLPRTDELGLHRVWSRGDGGEQRERASERFTVLLDPQESDLRRAEMDALSEAVPRGASVRAAAGDEPMVKLWPALLVLLALLFVLEAALLKKTVM